MTADESKRIANTPGYGTGKAARDRLAAESEARAILPPPEKLQAVEARSDDGGALMTPMAHMGNSSHDDQDWALCFKASDYQGFSFGHDARDDARTVAAIINAYRLGVLVLRDKP